LTESRPRTSSPPVPIEELIGPLNDVERRNAPASLYVIGDRAILQTEPRVSIVGSRESSAEGLQRARQLARLLARNGVPVVSGLALGIDAVAHETAMREGGKTIGVLGTPLDVEYPKENAGLQWKIMSEQLALSQFALGSPVRPSNFPVRNRLMALLSDATIIVEAQEKSGTIHQGWEALRLGRRLFILQSTADRAKDTKWVREFLDYGAGVIGKEEDLLEQLVLPAAASTVPAIAL